jgi:Protein of unknown function (DUF3147)
MNLDLLPLKLVMVPALIWAISSVGRRWGSIAAGSLSAFPVVVGPALIFIAIEQGATFAASAAAASFSGVLPLITFSLSYVWAATKLSWNYSLTLAMAAYCIAVIFIRGIELQITPMAGMVLCTILLVQHLFPAWRNQAITKNDHKISDIPLRMLVGGTLVYGLTIIAEEIGPTWSGIFAMFPVTGSVTLVFSHIQQGRDFAINMIRGMFIGWCSIAIFCLSLSILLPHQSIGLSFCIALASAVASQWIGYGFLQARGNL